jgi:hypothetical protein
LLSIGQAINLANAFKIFIPNTAGKLIFSYLSNETPWVKITMNKFAEENSPIATKNKMINHL